VICSDKSASVSNLMDGWLRAGKINPDVKSALEDLASKRVSPEEFAAALDQLVKEGKLTPEQARALLEEYKKQHTNAMLGDSEKMMDNLIKAGQLPLDVANQLLAAQRNGVTPTEYAALLQRLVREGKISPTVAQQLLQQYNKQCSQEAIDKHNVTIHQMETGGAITPDVAKALVALTNSNTPIDAYATQISSLTTQGKLTPAAGNSLLNAYRQVKSACGSAGTINELIRQAENEAYQELSDLLSAGKITPEVAAQISTMIQNNVPLDDFKVAINQLVQDKQLTPEIAQLKIGDYDKVKRYRDIKAQLETLQANNVSPEEYANQLKRLVEAGLITPEQAAQMLQEYQSLSVRPGPAAIATGEFGELQQKVLEGAAPLPVAIGTGEFASAQAQTAAEEAAARQARIEAITNAMTDQAGQLINSWQAPVMQHREGSFELRKAGEGFVPQIGTAGSSPDSLLAGGSTAAGPVLIKGGSVIFGVLDTAINSDYPDSPIMVTIVEGRFKGAKLLGKIVTTKGVTGQMDRVSLNFTMMNDDAWPKSRSVTAYAIDPDTARVVMASSVNYHYLQRYGAMMATSFLQGYAGAITNAGTSTTGIFGTSTTHPELSPSNKLMVALGQIGQNLGAATQNYINRPPTVRVDSGVSLGILFMTDVT
jgi:polyhydroxyalkanoate synthesis regulator phasin